MADADPRLRLLRVADSSTKAQNVNAACKVATGRIIGIFDADHHPVPGAFERAWHWIADGADVVQGHCVVRNGEQSLVAQTVAVEFEQIYAVSHPGRTSMHGFGIFGGSNGFWRAEVLRRVRLRADRLTEDIDASMRALASGARIVTDPGLVSRELAPVSLGALWRQRMRWAQGWFEVSLAALVPLLRSRQLSARQKWGVLALLGWRELCPWLSALPLPLIAFLAWRDGGIDWTVPLFLLTTAYTLSVGPLQALVAWRLAVPELRRRRLWFLVYVVVGVFVFGELKNLIVRVAQLKHLWGERHWAVTPRQVTAAQPPRVPEQRRAGIHR
jgi:cellulose synthase/poly-beta-1,6-N-acetylglucosamine synthase-like glycosyltransferase